jgi:hypothetical protein
MQSSCRPAAASPRDRSSATEQTRNPSAGSGKSAGDTEICIDALILSRVAHSNPAGKRLFLRHLDPLFKYSTCCTVPTKKHKKAVSC